MGGAWIWNHRQLLTQSRSVVVSNRYVYGFDWPYILLYELYSEWKNLAIVVAMLFVVEISLNCLLVVSANINRKHLQCRFVYSGCIQIEWPSKIFVLCSTREPSTDFRFTLKNDKPTTQHENAVNSVWFCVMCS